MPKYLVKSNIQKDGKLYEPGSKIELSEKEAAEMPWAVEAIPTPKEERAAAAEQKKEEKAEEKRKQAEN